MAGGRVGVAARPRLGRNRLIALRILHVIPAYYPAARYGGPVVAVHGLARALAARGHDVEIMTTNADGPGVSEVPVNEAVRRDGVTVRYFTPTAMRRIFWAPQMGAALRASASSFDVVHIHQMFHWPGWMAARQARGHQVPYVVSPRGMLIREMIERRSFFAKSAWIGLFDGPSLRHAAAIHVTSDLERVEFESFRFGVAAVATIPNGVEDPLPVPAEQAITADISAATAESFLLYLGRLSWKKGLERLIHGFARTLAGALVIAGPDDERLGPRLAGIAREFGVSQRVHLVPRFVEGGDKEYLFARARAFVLPSYSENFGNTVVEALRRGVPVITTPQVGAADIVRRSGGGIVTGGEPEALSYAMARFINHPALACSMGAAGRSHVTRHYGWPHVAERMEALYAGLAT